MNFDFPFIYKVYKITNFTIHIWSVFLFPFFVVESPLSSQPLPGGVHAATGEGGRDGGTRQEARRVAKVYDREGVLPLERQDTSRWQAGNDVAGR